VASEFAYHFGGRVNPHWSGLPTLMVSGDGSLVGSGAVPTKFPQRFVMGLVRVRLSRDAFWESCHITKSLVICNAHCHVLSLDLAWARLHSMADHLSLPGIYTAGDLGLTLRRIVPMTDGRWPLVLVVALYVMGSRGNVFDAFL